MQARVIVPGGGELIRHDGWEAAIKIDSAATDGGLTVLETRHDAGSGATPHIHSRESETFLVLAGTFTFRVGDDEVEVGAGGWVFGPPGLAHGFEPGPNGGRLLHAFVPGGVEGFFTRRRNASTSGDQLRREYGIESVEG